MYNHLFLFGNYFAPMNSFSFSNNTGSPTVCPRSSDRFYIASYHIKRVTASWTYCIMNGYLEISRCSPR